MMNCRKCGVELERSDSPGGEICDGCHEVLYEADDDHAHDNPFTDDSPYPEFDWMEEWLE